MAIPVVVRKLKFDGEEKRRFEGDLVEGGPVGWLAVFHEAARQRSWKMGELTFTSDYFVYLLNPAVPCVVSHYFDLRGHLLEAQADACLPPVISGREITFVDLDLDVIVRPDGSYYVRDFEDFRANVARLGYDGPAIKAAWDGLLWARQCAEARAFPFDGTASSVLGRALAAQGPL